MAIVDLGDGIKVEVPDATWNSLSEADKDAQKQLMRQAVAGGVTQNAEAPTQRARAAAQGLTLGFADEALAALSGAGSYLTGGGYTDAYNKTLADERAKLEQYRKAYPYSSIAWEAGGAVAPVLGALALSPFTGGGSTAAAAPTAGRLAALTAGALRGGVQGAKYGTAYGFGSGEGGFMDRAANAGVQGMFGGILGGALGAAGSALKTTVVDGFVSWVRNKTGDRMAGTVAREVQRLAEQGGLTADEVVQGVAEGRLMAENRTLDNMIRRFYAEGGPAGAEIKRVLSERPGETRTAALEEMQKALGSPGNPLANRRASEALAKEAEDLAYEKAFAPSGIELTAPPETVRALEIIAQRTPAALREAAELARAERGIKPFFTEAADGTITFTRTPTVREAELTYRALRDMKGEAFQKGAGARGKVLAGTAEELKGQISPPGSALEVARTEAANVRNARDAFVAGQKAASKSPDQLALEIQDIEALGPDAMAAFREGLLTSIRAGLAKPTAAPALMRALANEETGPGTALRLALPPGTAPAVTQRLTTAADAQRASTKILEGSATAPTELAPRIGGGVNAAQEVASGMQGDLMAWARLVGGLADNVGPRLTDSQRLEVARIVLSKDPNLVLRALKDNSLIGELQGLTAQAVDQVVRAGTRAVPQETEYLTRRDRQR